MDYLTNHYKNLSEQLQNKINILQKVLLESDMPPVGPDIEGIGDTAPITSRKEFQDNGLWITPTNWQGLYNQWQKLRNGPVPNWFLAEYWGGLQSNGGTWGSVADAWDNFCAQLLGAISRAGQYNNPEIYWDIQSQWQYYTAQANNGQPLPFPVRHGGRYTPQIGMHQVGGRINYIEPHPNM
jgi:hypothetical protein